MTVPEVQQSRLTQSQRVPRPVPSASSFSDSVENIVQPKSAPQSSATPSLSERMGRFYQREQRQGQSPASLNTAVQKDQDQEKKPTEKTDEKADVTQKGGSGRQDIDPKSTLSKPWLITQTLINSGRNIVRVVPAINGSKGPGTFQYVNSAKGTKAVFSIAMAADGIWQFSQIGNDDPVAKSAAGHNAAIGSAASMRTLASTTKGLDAFRTGAVSLVKTEDGLKLAIEAGQARNAAQIGSTAVTTAGDASKILSISGTAAARAVGIAGSVAIATLQADAAQENFLHSDQGAEAKKERAAQVASALTYAGLGIGSLAVLTPTFAALVPALAPFAVPIATAIAILGLAMTAVYVYTKIKTGKGFDPPAELYKAFTKLENSSLAKSLKEIFSLDPNESLSDEALGKFAEASHKAVSAVGLGEYLHQDEIEKLAKEPPKPEAVPGETSLFTLSEEQPVTAGDATEPNNAEVSLANAGSSNSGIKTGPAQARQGRSPHTSVVDAKRAERLSAQKAEMLNFMSSNIEGPKRTITAEQAADLKLKFQAGKRTERAQDALDKMALYAPHAYQQYLKNQKMFYAIGNNQHDAQGNPAFYHYLPNEAELEIFDTFYAGTTKAK
jgi:hypothetical protein